MYKTGEIYEIMNEFEKNAAGLYGLRFTREQRDVGETFKSQAYYEHGETNNAFRVFMAGYALGRGVERLEHL